MLTKSERRAIALRNLKKARYVKKYGLALLRLKETGTWGRRSDAQKKRRARITSVEKLRKNARRVYSRPMPARKVSLSTTVYNLCENHGASPVIRGIVIWCISNGTQLLKNGLRSDAKAYHGLGRYLADILPKTKGM